MAYAFCVRYQGRNEFFSPPAGTSNVDIKEAVAAAFNVPVGSFAIRRESEAGFFHAGLRGHWELVEIRGRCHSASTTDGEGHIASFPATGAGTALCHDAISRVPPTLASPLLSRTLGAEEGEGAGGGGVLWREVSSAL